MKVLSIVLLLFTAFSASAEIPSYPEGVSIAKENTLVICDVMEIHGLLAAGKDYEPKQDRHKVHDICANAFQISPTEIMTAAHVMSPPELMLLAHLNNRRLMTERHDFTHDRTMPHGEMKVVFYRELQASDGLILKTPTLTFVDEWGHKLPTKDDILSFAKNLFDKGWDIDDSDARIVEEIVDTDRDLGLMILNKPIVRDSYITVGSYRNELNEKTWAVLARKPYHESPIQIPNYGVNSGVVIALNSHPNIPHWQVGETTEVDMVQSKFMNIRGVSGSPNVDANGILMGVTHGGLNPVVMDVMPQCNTVQMTGRMFSCARWIIAGREVDEFLSEVRQ